MTMPTTEAEDAEVASGIALLQHSLPVRPAMTHFDHPLRGDDVRSSLRTKPIADD